MVDGVGEALMGGLSTLDDLGLARSFGDRCDPAQAAQRVIISALQGLPGFCQQRGEDDPSDARQGSEDRHVTLRPALLHLVLPRFAGLGIRSRLRHAFGQAVEPGLGFGILAVDQIEPLGEGLDMGDGGLGCARCDQNGGTAQPLEHVRSCEAADAVALEQSGDGLLAHPPRLLGRGKERPQVEKPAGRDIVGEVKDLRIVAPELFADAVAQSVALGPQFLSHARPLPQLDQHRVERREPAETPAVGPERVGQDLRIPAVVLGTGGREAIPEAIELLGIDGVDTEAAFQEAFHHGTVGDLDRHVDPVRLDAGHGNEPSGHVGQALAAMGKDALAGLAAP
ncbi:hypothetical protein ABB55_06390 [Prosthecomicrobium hirschii]|uniref:Uncharacterized protein n=1 Tax=Prosthecodimorpha hirschii TaxID=665126 RepID=A0A0P6W179_9HYPH|nr:hypothetical protein ABB55_06390 [Prosthecomicrobium hirschii]